MRSSLGDAIDGTLTHRTAFMNHDVSNEEDVIAYSDISEVVTDIVNHESGEVVIVNTDMTAGAVNAGATEAYITNREPSEADRHAYVGQTQNPLPTASIYTDPGI